MELVINKCFGGFGLSARAMKRMAELQGRECYFYKMKGGDFYTHTRITDEEAFADCGLLISAYSVPNVDDAMEAHSQRNWYEMTDAERKASNEAWAAITVEMRPEDRTDQLLIQTVKELGKDANTRYSNLRVVSIPDGAEYEIEDYDGMESVHQKHEVWA